MVENKLDSAIRFFLFVLIFWLPYSPAVIESCVIISFLLWILKRAVVASRQKNLPPTLAKRLLKYIECFKPVSSAINKPIVFFLAVCIFSVANSAFHEQSLHNFLTKTLEWFIVYFLVLEVFLSKKSIYILIFIFIFTGLATGLDSLVQFYLTHKDIFLGHTIEAGARPTAGFKAPNGLGAYLTLIIPVLLAITFSNKKNLRYFLLVSLISLVMVWSLILTGSRGAWLGVFFALLFALSVYLFSGKKMKLRFFLGLLVGIVFLYVLILLIHANNPSLELLARHQTVYWRLDVWKDSIEMIKDRPLFGHGINTFMSLFEMYRTGSGTSPTYAHNCYLQLAVETGVVGLIGFLWIIVKLFRDSLNKINVHFKKDPALAVLSMGLLSGIFAFLIHSSFDTHFYSLQLSVYLWFMIGMQVAICNCLSKARIT